VRPLPSCNRSGVQPASWEAPFEQQYQLPALVESENLSIAEEYEQGRRSKQKKKRSEQSLRSQKTKRQRDKTTSKKRQTTYSPLVRKASNWTTGIYLFLKDKRRVISFCVKLFAEFGYRNEGKNVYNFNKQQQNKTSWLARTFIYYGARSSWWKYVDETKETTTGWIRARRRTPVSSFQAGERTTMRSRLSLQRLQIGAVETVSDGEGMNEPRYVKERATQVTDWKRSEGGWETEDGRWAKTWRARNGRAVAYTSFRWSDGRW
jgi:hypothetical protein